MNRKTILGLLLLFSLVAAVIYISGSLLLRGSLSSFIVSPFGNKIVTFRNLNMSPTPTPDPLRPFTILLLGYGGGKHQGGLLTDSMILTRIDPRLKKIHLLSIPRDMWVNLPLTPEQNKSYKINAAYAIGSDDRNYPDKPLEYKGPAGGGMMAKYAVHQALGIPIDYFISLDFDGFVKAIDALGGVDISIPQSFVDPWYPLSDKITDTCGKSDEEVKALTATLSGDLLEHEFTCRYEQLAFAKGDTHVDGATALKFVRSRHSAVAGNDFGRSQRQRALLSAVREKVFSIGFIPKLIPFVNSFKGNLLTDLTVDDMSRLLNITRDAQDYKIFNIALSTDNILTEAVSQDHQYILTSKEGEHEWGSVHRYLTEAINSTQSAETAQTK